MRVQFLKDVTVDVLIDENGETDFDSFSKNEVIDVSQVVSVSKNFSEIVLPSGNVIIDVRNDLFREVVA
jgi:hypothetical protein